ncbi:NAD(P)/FAD-dependent oxidoreductase [Roseobacter sp. S98]|uniref:NAD(P)/FAD-dependent oxidoreductase n=1 Tax=Roseobacter algicola (ex Choi et al. 2025) (nom. illeg.) TaxID=3092138 RepID=UPI0035C754E8
MKRIFPDFAYGDGPRSGCWWDETSEMQDRPAVQESAFFDVVVVGGGFTGISAAFHLARAGASVAVLETRYVGWGASGRNGGFCCLGGSKADDGLLDRRYGKPARLEWRQAEKCAVELVDSIITDEGLDVDRHSDGETALAHRARDMKGLRDYARSVQENYGVEPVLHEAHELATQGMSAGFHGALTVPIGFGLNPRKYLDGLAAAAERHGAVVFHGSPVSHISSHGSRRALDVNGCTVTAEQVIIATNGYSSEDLPDWLAGRYLPTQSNVLVTRPLSPAELDAQGWTSRQMSFDTRNLLHYFRLMPDNRFLFGMRGGIFSGPLAEHRARRSARRDFERMFPAWADAETEASWSGLVCLSRSRMPFAGLVPGAPGIWAGMCYHGNGVAMGTFTGKLLADLISGRQPDLEPKIVGDPLQIFPFGGARRLFMLPLYAGLQLLDL